MLYEQLSKNLKEGETLVQHVRRDLIASVMPLSFAAILVLLDFFLLVFFVRSGTWGIVGFFTVLVAALVLGFRALFEWRLNALLITNERVVHVFQKGFFTRTVSETTYDKVTDVRSTVHGVLQTALQYGSVEVQTAGENENLRLEGVRHPAQVQALLTNILRTSRDQQGAPLTAQELVAALTKAKRELGGEAFSELLSRVSDGDRRTGARK